jgi:hypothetical protein
MALNNQQIRIFKKRMQSLAAILLLLLYIAANVEFEAIHHEFHDEVHVTHTEADEHDPCHRSLYHQNEESCHHAHLTTIKKCPLCHFNVVNEKVLTAIPTAKEVVSDTKVTTDFYPSFVSSTTASLPSRAPPIAG